MRIWDRVKPSFGFLSTRFAGTDGVSLETEKWVEVLERRDCPVCFCAGELDLPPERSYRAPHFSFKHPEIIEIQNQLFVAKHRDRVLTLRIQDLKDRMYQDLVTFREQFWL